MDSFNSLVTKSALSVLAPKQARNEIVVQTFSAAFRVELILHAVVY